MTDQPDPYTPPSQEQQDEIVRLTDSFVAFAASASNGPMLMSAVVSGFVQLAAANPGLARREMLEDLEMLVRMLTAMGDTVEGQEAFDLARAAGPQNNVFERDAAAPSSSFH